MVAEFVVEEGDLIGLILSLDQGEEWIIGSDADQSDLLLSETELDPKQLRCHLTDEGYFLENLSPTREVFLDGELLTQPSLLKDGSRIAIDKLMLRFFLDNEEAPLFTAEHEEEEIPSAESQFVAEAMAQAKEEELVEEEAVEEEAVEEEIEEEPIAEEEEEEEIPFEEVTEFHVDLTQTARFILKVIAGPNTGAEYAIDLGRDYLIGTDTTTCDIVFHDLSVSREHARLHVSEEGELSLEDLDSRNGVVVDQRRIKEKLLLPSSAIITIGTTSFFLIDREAPQETIVAPIFEPFQEEEELEEEEEIEEEIVPQEAKVVEEEKPAKGTPPPGALILSCIVMGLIFLLGLGIFSLSHTKEVNQPPRDYMVEIQDALKPFPGIKYTYNKTTKKLFLVGHVTSGVEVSELLYNLQALYFLRGTDNNVINDEAIWQEMNLLLAKHPDFKGVSMHSPQPGLFVLSGYLKTEEQAADLVDYMNLHFNYLNLLENRVVVEKSILEEVAGRLMQNSFTAVTPAFSNGELILTGYVGSTQTAEFDTILKEFGQIAGVRSIQNYVVVVSPEQQVINLSLRYPGRYKVTGYSKHGNVNVNVVINGKILSRGDALDDMTITSIQPHTIFLEKEGLKYKIEYNK